MNFHVYESFCIWVALLDHSLCIFWICQRAAGLFSRMSVSVYNIHRNLMRVLVSLPTLGMIQPSKFFFCTISKNWCQCFNFHFSNYMNLGIILFIARLFSRGFPFTCRMFFILCLFFNWVALFFLLISKSCLLI